MQDTSNPELKVSQQEQGGVIYSILKLFTDVRPGEAITAALLALNIFLLLAAYYILKPVRDGLIIGEWSSETKSYLAAVIAVTLVFVVKGFSAIASRFPRQKLITVVTSFFISNLVLFFVLQAAGVSSAAMGIVFFIWIGIFNVMVVAQFWGFANDLYSKEAGERLFPLVAFGATFGGFSGSTIADWLIGPFGLFQLMLVAGGILVVCIVFTWIIHNREIKIPAPSVSEKPVEVSVEKPLEKGGGFKLVFKKRYLLYLAFFVLILNFVNTNGEYALGKIAEMMADQSLQTGTAEGLSRSELVGAFWANFYKIVNFFTMFIQLFLVSRIFKWFGVRAAVFFLPFIALGGYFTIAAGAALIMVKWAKIFENSTDYSLMNTTRHALFLITTREEKYKAKAAIDTFFHRAGDVFSAFLVFLGTTYLALNIQKVAVFNVMLILIWIMIGVLLVREHKKLTLQKAS